MTLLCARSLWTDDRRMDCVMRDHTFNIFGVSSEMSEDSIAWCPKEFARSNDGGRVLESEALLNDDGERLLSGSTLT